MVGSCRHHALIRTDQSLKSSCLTLKLDQREIAVTQVQASVFDNVATMEVRTTSLAVLHVRALGQKQTLTFRSDDARFTAGKLEPERRDIFLQRVGAMLRMRGRFTDGDVNDVTKAAA